MGGVLLIDEAYYLYRPENERDYGQEAIEILLQFMEKHREDLVVILAGYADRMDTFFRSNPGMASRIAHHIDFPDFTLEELLAIAEQMLEREQYRLSPAAEEAFAEYSALRMSQPRFANARSIRNAIDRLRLRQARRLVAGGGLHRARRPDGDQRGGCAREPGLRRPGRAGYPAMTWGCGGACAGGSGSGKAATARRSSRRSVTRTITIVATVTTLAST